jgi:hypothetical protein
MTSPHRCDESDANLQVRWERGVLELSCVHGYQWTFHPPADVAGSLEGLNPPRWISRQVDIEPGGLWPPRVKGCRWCSCCRGPACQRHGGPGPAARQTWWRHHRRAMEREAAGSGRA